MWGSLRLAPIIYTEINSVTSPLNSLVWGSLRLAPINSVTSPLNTLVWGSLRLAPNITTHGLLERRSEDLSVTS